MIMSTLKKDSSIEMRPTECPSVEVVEVSTKDAIRGKNKPTRPV